MAGSSTEEVGQSVSKRDVLYAPLLQRRSSCRCNPMVTESITTDVHGSKLKNSAPRLPQRYACVRRCRLLQQGLEKSSNYDLGVSTAKASTNLSTHTFIQSPVDWKFEYL